MKIEYIPNKYQLEPVVVRHFEPFIIKEVTEINNLPTKEERIEALTKLIIKLEEALLSGEYNEVVVEYIGVELQKIDILIQRNELE